MPGFISSLVIALISACPCNCLDIDATNFCHEPSLVASLADLQKRKEWFSVPGEALMTTPAVIVKDDFYSEEELAYVLNLANSSPYMQYWPGQENEPWQWNSSCLYVRTGELLPEPFEGNRYTPEHLRKRFEIIIGENVDDEKWQGIRKIDGKIQPIVGDGWNGVFHRFNARWVGGAVHHHWKIPDVAPRGWSGVLYLVADENSTCTTFWQERNTSTCVGRNGSDFEGQPLSRFNLAYAVQAKVNRLVLFREKVFHRAELGSDNPFRLTQTFFFESTEGKQEL